LRKTTKRADTSVHKTISGLDIIGNAALENIAVCQLKKTKNQLLRFQQNHNQNK
jgi:hypothetical protein